MKIHFIVLILITLAGCSDIPDQRLALNTELESKLSKLQTVRLVRNPNIFSIECRWFEPGTDIGYYLLSGDGKLTDDYAMWKCANELKYLPCPSMTIESDKSEAIISVNSGDKSQYSKEQVQRCATAAIKHAPTEMTATSDDVANRDSWN
ncbi:MAG: hypothetical protein CML22_07030 [Rheinheimera sp.]|nr:hypothetical protein [Rheinheimera sp.]MBM34037.1 hypothetical protein [Rheinheimera sp.]|tara:strand:- start:2695 stop:3144 length:450 start_codon:yes stop_codon:yes gene_type:complete